MASDDEILTVKEVGEILQVHPSTIYKLTRLGKIPAFRVGSDWRFRKDVIERWIGDEAIALEAE
jgi:excisionase family DNA binding protein